MGLKTAGVGHFTIPTAPAAGTSVTSGTANTFTTTYVALSTAAPAALFITGIHVEAAAAKAATYIVVQLATGTAGSEAVVGQYLVPLSTASTVALGYRQIYPPIAVANGVRIAAKTADSVGSAATLVTLECINQANVVDDGVVVGTVSTVSAVTGLTASNLDVAVSTRMATYTQPTGFLAATFPTGTIANTTNVTAGTITTVTNLTNAPTAGDLTATMKTSVTTAATAATPTAAAVTGAVGSVTGAVGSVTGAVGSVTGNVGGNVVGSVASVTAAVTLPSIPTNWITAAGITAAALNGKGDWPVGKTGYSLTTADWAKAGDAMTLTVAYDAAKTAASSADYTAARALKIDNLDAAISTRSTYAGGDTAGTTTLLARVTATRAGNLDSLDATVSSRLASASYTAPDNASVTAIKAKTDSLTFTVAGKLDGNVTAINGVAILGDGSASPFHI